MPSLGWVETPPARRIAWLARRVAYRKVPGLVGIDSAAKLADMLLRVCPDLRILATSREALGIGGEAVLRLSPLTTPDADSKFAARAVTALPGFQLTEANQHVVSRICSKVEGLPLAIELAAARLKAMSPEQILERLADRYALTRGSRGAPTRQQTLGWSVVEGLAWIAAENGDYRRAAMLTGAAETLGSAVGASTVASCRISSASTSRVNGHGKALAQKDSRQPIGRAANSASTTPSPTRWVNRLALRLSFRDKFGSDLHERHVGILRKLA